MNRGKLNFLHITAELLLFLIIVNLLFCSMVFGRPIEILANSDLALLRYEINRAHVGMLNHTIQIVNHSPLPITGELFIPLIKNRTALQYTILRNISLSKEIDYSVLNDSSGNTYLHWRNLTISGEKTFKVELNYHVFSFNTNYIVNPSLVEDYNARSELYVKYTSSEEKVECKHPKITLLAQNITGKLKSWHEKAEKIYDFVHCHMSYEFQDEERGALWALEKGIGDCSEFSYLFVALCRAAGIPARIQAGFAFHHEKETLEDGHMWAEYYLENYGWLPVDVTWQLFDEIDERHFSSIRSIPDNISYVNYLFDSENEDIDLEDKQTVSLFPLSPQIFNGDSVEYIIKTIKKTGETEFMIFLGEIFGTYLIFPKEAEDAEQTLLEGKIKLQKAIESWDEDVKTTESNAQSAYEHVQQSLQTAGGLTAKMFMIFVTLSIVVMLAVLIILKQY